ncbi:MAG: hypothetical protein B7C24_14955 [Bacteroidetes bacterium 4572_77]|nr:MAG: hypothetical protein B7C24_14955 [Bacteroidetes bacterium 4572_77]
MALKKGFLTPEISSLNISKKRFIIGIALWLFFSLVFYSLLCLIREGFRLTTVTDYCNIWMFSEDEIFFYNIIFAFVSTIFAQSILMVYLIQMPRNAHQKRRFRRSDIFNDHTFYSWNFISWFSKIGIAYGIWVGSAGASFYYSFSFYPKYNYVFVLLIMVLFLSSWNSFLRIFKRKAYKWFLLSMLSVSVVSFALANMNIIDHNLHNEKILKQNPFYNYQVDRVESKIYSSYERRDLVGDIYLVYPKGKTKNNKPLVLIENEEINMGQLKNALENYRCSWDKADRRLITMNMIIHKDLPMSFVNRVKFQMSSAGLYRLSYSVIPTNMPKAKDYPFPVGFNIRIPNLGDGPYPKSNFDQWYENAKIDKIQYVIRQIDTAHCSFNDSIIKTASLYELFYNTINQEPDYLFLYYINENLSFESYFEIISIFRQVIIDLKEEYSLNIFGKHYQDLDWDQRKEMRNKYPARIIELSPEMITYLKAE